MVNLTTIRHFKINKDLNIGTVIFVVEGEKDDFNLLKRIFVDIFGYKIEVPHVKDPDFMELRKNENNRVIVIRSDNSAINTLDKFDGYREKVYAGLFMKYGVDWVDSPVFYIWDRDRGSNTAGMVEKLIREMYSPYDNGYRENGLLLLSYPCLESYIASCYTELEYFDKNGSPKDCIKNQHFAVDNIDADMILGAAGAMVKTFKDFGLEEFDLNNFVVTSLKIFEIEEEIFREYKTYRLISLFSIALMYLGLVTVE